MMSLSPSLENYLKQIWLIQESKKVVRVKELAQRLGVKTSSVVNSLRELAKRGLVVHERYGYVELTPAGIEQARKIHYRYQVLTRFFLKVLELSVEDASENACQIEHYLSLSAFREIEKLTEFFEEHSSCKKAFLLFQKGAGTTFSGSGGGGAGSQLRLSELKIGEVGKVVKVEAHSSLRRRLLDMGLVSGAEVKIERVAPLGDPIEILVKGYHLSLRKDEAETIWVKKK